LLLARSHQAETKKATTNASSVGVEPRSCNHGLNPLSHSTLRYCFAQTNKKFQTWQQKDFFIKSEAGQTKP